MPEIINLKSTCHSMTDFDARPEDYSELIEIEFPDDGSIVTITAHHDDGDYYVASADWLACGGIDMWCPAYIGTSDTLLEMWQRIYAYLGT